MKAGLTWVIAPPAALSFGILFYVLGGGELPQLSVILLLLLWVSLLWLGMWKGVPLIMSDLNRKRPD